MLLLLTLSSFCVSFLLPLKSNFSISLSQLYLIHPLFFSYLSWWGFSGINALFLQETLLPPNKSFSEKKKKNQLVLWLQVSALYLNLWDLSILPNSGIYWLHGKDGIVFSHPSVWGGWGRAAEGRAVDTAGPGVPHALGAVDLSL